MPRASDYLLEGYSYHLTQRCHNRTFLLRFARDRTVFVDWLREGVRRFSVPVYGYCITGNHIHLIVHVTSAESVGRLMHLASGSTAKQYNLRKDHLGSMWERPYQCTLVQDGNHLFNCLCYVDLNMVRAGVVAHPRDWRWCGYHELTGRRKRYRFLALDRLFEAVGVESPDAFRQCYEEALQARIAADQLTREPFWTEALAVGTRDFTKGLAEKYPHRQQLDRSQAHPSGRDAWVLRESRTAYDPFSKAESGPKA